MIYRLLLLSEENDFFRRELQIDAEATFLDLNNFILESLRYDAHELTSFYVCGAGWEVEQEITLMDMGTSDSATDVYLMADTRLEDFVEEKGKRLLFVYDLLNERSFSVELMELLPGSLPKPEMCLSEGKAPRQIADLDLSAPMAAATTAANDLGFGEDFYGEDFDASDLDEDGYTQIDDLEGY
ncbi:MAG: hypothetical protein SPK09_01150 [Porphyromonas sp.]|nr:hypothetical protein [Porphyromonas sp.]